MLDNPGAQTTIRPHSPGNVRRSPPAFGEHSREVLAERGWCEAEIAKLTEFLSAPDLFAKEPAKFNKATEALTERQSALAAAEEEWLELAERG